MTDALFHQAETSVLLWIQSRLPPDLNLFQIVEETISGVLARTRCGLLLQGLLFRLFIIGQLDDPKTHLLFLKFDYWVAG